MVFERGGPRKRGPVQILYDRTVNLWWVTGWSSQKGVFFGEVSLYRRIIMSDVEKNPNAMQTISSSQIKTDFVYHKVMTWNVGRRTTKKIISPNGQILHPYVCL